MSAPFPAGTLYRRLRSADTGDIAETAIAELAQCPVSDPERPTVRRRAIEVWLPLAQHLTRRYTGRGESEDDLLQVAVVGLIKAVDRYEHDRGIGFAAFAIPTILGEMKRHFRDRTWSVRPPRRLQQLWADINRAQGELTQRLGRVPTVADVARHLRLAEEDVLEGLEGGRAYSATSLSAPTQRAGAPELGDTIGGLDQEYGNVENRMALRLAMSHLNEREAYVVRLFFQDELSQSEIGERLGISQMHVSRMLATSVARLRTEMLGAEVGPARTIRRRKPAR